MLLIQLQFMLGLAFFIILNDFLTVEAANLIDFNDSYFEVEPLICKKQTLDSYEEMSSDR
jgi:hypothetical protein